MRIDILDDLLALAVAGLILRGGRVRPGNGAGRVGRGSWVRWHFGWLGLGWARVRVWLTLARSDVVERARNVREGLASWLVLGDLSENLVLAKRRKLFGTLSRSDGAALDVDVEVRKG